MSRRLFYAGILISLCLHLLVLIFGQFVAGPPPPRPAAIEITLLEPPHAQKPPAVLTQIVDQSEVALNDELDPKAKYLSRHNQRVERETKAQNHGKFVNSDNGGAHEQARTQKLAQGPGKHLTLHDLKPNLDWRPEAFAQKSGLGPSQTDDFVKDAESGPETLLNTREFIYYTYYARIKDKLRQHWEPKIKEKMSRLIAQGRTIASNQERITKMIITLNDQGTLIRVQVIGESGVRDLDDAAIEAFRAAAPFPHPPNGIVDSDGTIKIRWDFVLEAQNRFFDLHPTHMAQS